MQSEGVQIAFREHWLLLVLLNVLTIIQPTQPTRTIDISFPECNTNNFTPIRLPEHYCVTGDLYIEVKQYKSYTAYFTFTCEGLNVTFPAPPEYRPKHLELILYVFSCSPSDVINYLYKLYDELTIHQAEIKSTNKLTSADMDSLKNIKILSFKLDANTTIPVNASCSWSTSTKLTIRGGKLISQQLTEDVEVNTTRLPANSFCGLTSLLEFYIQDNNNVDTIEADAFRGLNELQKLSSIYGKLKYIEVGAFSGTPMLTSLDLSYNDLEQLPNGLFQSLENIVEVLLQGNQLKVIDSHAFAQLPSLKLIDISNCTITSLPENVFRESDNIKTLYIHQNNLESLSTKIFRDQRHLETLYLGYNRLQDPRKLNIFNNLKTLKRLDLSNNQIKTLPKSLFLELGDLEEMDLSYNNISTITDALVRDPRYYIETLNDRIEKPFEANPFKYLAKLKRLNLAGNHISALFYMQKDFQPLLHLEYLNFSRNKIQYYNLNILRENFTNLNITIDLSYNGIDYLQLEADELLEFNPKEANSSIILTGNPIKCDCSNYGLYLRLNGAIQPGEPNYILDSYCTKPSHFNGQYLKNIPPELLICNHTYSDCLESCSSCIVIKNEMNMNCQKLPSVNLIYRITGPYDAEVNSISLKMNYQPISLEDRDIHKLNLSNARIKSITFIPNNKLEILDVSNNYLSTIPEAFSKANYTLYLSNNPFECECEFVRDIFALYERGLLPDYSEMTCANGDKVSEIDINELCTRSIRLISLIGCSTIGSFVALVTVIKLYMNAHNIWMSFLKLFCKRKYQRTRIEMREIGIETAKVYDLFISYAHQDENFVAETLLPKLENEFNQKVCVHTRDWVVGHVIANQIIESVENSRKTVIILSEHFLMSEWSEVEFHTAHNWSIQEGKSRIIIIVLKEEVVRDERMGAELKSYISTNTYLLWGDPLFWEKLQKVLPGKIPKHIW